MDQPPTKNNQGPPGRLRTGASESHLSSSESPATVSNRILKSLFHAISSDPYVPPQSASALFSDLNAFHLNFEMFAAVFTRSNQAIIGPSFDPPPSDLAKIYYGLLEKASDLTPPPLNDLLSRLDTATPVSDDPWHEEALQRLVRQVIASEPGGDAVTPPEPFPEKFALLSALPHAPFEPPVVFSLRELGKRSAPKAWKQVIAHQDIVSNYALTLLHLLAAYAPHYAPEVKLNSPVTAAALVTASAHFMAGSQHHQIAWHSALPIAIDLVSHLFDDLGTPLSACQLPDAIVQVTQHPTAHRIAVLARPAPFSTFPSFADAQELACSLLYFGTLNID